MVKRHSRKVARKTRRVGRKSRRHPKKGQKSRTRRGRRDFTTKRGNKKFNRRSHRQRRAQGSKVKRRPYRARGGWNIPTPENTSAEQTAQCAQHTAAQAKAAGVECGGVRTKGEPAWGQ